MMLLILEPLPPAGAFCCSGATGLLLRVCPMSCDRAFITYQDIYFLANDNQANVLFFCSVNSPGDARERRKKDYKLQQLIKLTPQ